MSFTKPFGLILKEITLTRSDFIGPVAPLITPTSGKTIGIISASLYMNPDEEPELYDVTFHLQDENDYPLTEDTPSVPTNERFAMPFQMLSYRMHVDTQVKLYTSEGSGLILSEGSTLTIMVAYYEI